MFSPTVHSPSACSSPSQEFPPGDPLECLTLDLPFAKNVFGTSRLLSFAETSGPGNDDVSHGTFLDDSSQKKLLSQKVTPPPSPLLSELLKKGSILATNSRLVVEVDVSTGNTTGTQDLQLAPASQPLSQASGAPMLSRLLEAGPTQFSPPLGFMAGGDSASGVLLSTASPVPVDANVSANSEVHGLVSSVAPECRPASTEKMSVVSEDDVTMSYMGDELDLKTVGDIIAIIEEKADEAAEALDAAAVEAALSLCEENGHALSVGWDSGPFQPQESPSAVPIVVSQSSSLPCGLEGDTEAPLSSLYNSQDSTLTVSPVALRNLPSTSSCRSKTLKHCRSPSLSQFGAMRHMGEK
ncbi:bromodomain-containing protein 8-like [Xenentodon cancila]